MSYHASGIPEDIGNLLINKKFDYIIRSFHIPDYSNISDSEQSFDSILLYFRTDYADLSCYIGCTCSYGHFARNIIEVDLLTVFSCYDTLCAENDSELGILIKLGKSCLDNFPGVLP